jgi:tetratricopeptide (TPR) repeat protein
MENFSASLSELERLADLAPANWEVRTRLAALYHKLERYDEAMDQARAILEKESDNIHALRSEGAIHLIQGNEEEAKAIFERITALDSAGENGESGDTSSRFMIEEPESRYWLDLVPPPAAQLPEPSASKPVSTHPGAIALAKARAAKKAALAGEQAEPITEVLEVALTIEVPEPESAGEGDLLGLMRYLMNLTEALPEPVLDEFMHSDEHIEMKYIIETLESADE